MATTHGTFRYRLKPQATLMIGQGSNPNQKSLGGIHNGEWNVSRVEL